MRLTMPWSPSQTHHNGNGHKIDEIRSALGKEVDHLASVAAQLSQDLGAQARAAASDAGSQARAVAGDVGAQATTAARDVAQTAQTNAGGIVRQLAEGAAAIGPALAVMGRKRAEQIGRDVQTIGEDLRRVRLTTEPQRKGPDLMPGVALLGGFGAGIALMYFLDPDRGKRRRALLRDQLVKWTRIGSEAASGKAKDLRNRAAGAVIEAKKAVLPVQPEVAELDTNSYESFGYGSTQTPEAPENSEQETRATIA